MSSSKPSKVPTFWPSKYAYVIENPFWIKFRIWFALSGLGISMWGLFSFYRQYPLLSVPFVVLTLYLIIFIVLSNWVNLSYNPFDKWKHIQEVKRFKASGWNPSVDVFLPVAGEPLSVLEDTWEKVSAMDYSNYTVYVLDDKGDIQVAALARRYGYNYLSRRNKGYYKKAGNIRYGFAKTKGEFFVIFDADFQPRPEFISELLPYMRDSDTAIVQSPQCFAYTENLDDTKPLQYAAALVQEDFYRKTQQALQSFGASVCVGSNAIYRRAALKHVHGAVKITHSEDLHTGFEMVSLGFKLTYIPLCLAFGDCPDELGAWIKQQIRWCQGSLALFPSKKYFVAKMNLQTKLAYIIGWLYYYSSFLNILFPYLIYLVFLVGAQTSSYLLLLVYLPLLINDFLLFPLFRTKPFRPSMLYAHYLLTYIHIFTITRNIFGENSWVPTATGNIGKSEKRAVLDLVSNNLMIHLGILFPMILTGVINVANPITYVTLIWVIIEIIKMSWIIIYTYTTIEPSEQNKQPQRESYLFQWGISAAIGLLLGILIMSL